MADIDRYVVPTERGQRLFDLKLGTELVGGLHRAPLCGHRAYWRYRDRENGQERQRQQQRQQKKQQRQQKKQQKQPRFVPSKTLFRRRAEPLPILVCLSHRDGQRHKAQEPASTMDKQHVDAATAQSAIQALLSALLPGEEIHMPFSIIKLRVFPERRSGKLYFKAVTHASPD